MGPGTQAQPSCELETLSQNGIAHVQRCHHCGTIALNLGAVTLRFDAASAEVVWATLGDALLGLRQKQGDRDELRYAPVRGSA